MMDVPSAPILTCLKFEWIIELLKSKLYSLYRSIMILDMETVSYKRLKTILSFFIKINAKTTHNKNWKNIHQNASGYLQP